MYIKEIIPKVLHLLDEKLFTSEELEAAISKGYTKVVEHELPADFDPATMDYNVTYEMNAESGLYQQKYNIHLSQEKISGMVAALKAQLAASDYKIIKLMEYQMLAASPMTVDEDGNGIEIPEANYNIADLHKERQAVRNQINRLKQLLKNNEI